MPLPSNIKSWLSSYGSSEQIEAANTIAQWCDKLKHPIRGGDVMGRFPHQSLVLDLKHNEGEIYIAASGFGTTDRGYPGVTFNGEEIDDGSNHGFQQFKAEMENYFGGKTASAKLNTRIAGELVRIARELVSSDGE